MPVRSANAVWEGSLKEGQGKMQLGSGAYDGAFSYATRFEEAPGTNPEELLGAAQAGCFSMFLASLLTKAGFTPERIETKAKVHLSDGKIGKIELTTQAHVPGIDDATLREHAENAKENCPVSKALAGPERVLTITLVG